MIAVVICLDARPEPFAIDPDRTAVIVIDMQNDFGAEGGMFDRAGIDISAIVAAAVATRPVLAAARAAGVPVIYLTMEHPADLSNVGPRTGPHWLKHVPLGLGNEIVAPDGSPSRTLVRATWSTRVVDALSPDPDDVIVSKHRFSGFFESELDDVLRGLGANSLIVTGCTTSVCVESTVRDAMFRDYRCVVLEDCSAEPIGASFSRTNHEASLLVIETLFGWVSNAGAACDALASLPRRERKPIANA